MVRVPAPFIAVCLVVAVCLFGRAAACAAADDTDPAVTPMAEIRDLPRASLAANPEARVRGIVTRSSPTALVIQDATGGLYVNISQAIKRGWLPGPLSAGAAPFGAEVAIKGVLDPGGFSPIIVPREIVNLGPGTVPEPTEIVEEELFDGSADSELAAITGIVTEAVRRRDRWWLVVQSGQIEVVAVVADDALDQPAADLIDARVRFRGVTAALFNTRGEIRRPVLHVEQPGWLQVLKPATHPPFESPAFPLAELSRFRPEPNAGHMVRTSGTVVHVIPGEAVFLQEGAWGLMVEAASQEPLAVGDRVEAAGFVGRRPPVASLVHAQVRRLSAGEPPAPFPLTPQQAVKENTRVWRAFTTADPGDYCGCLVRFPAHLLESRTLPGRGVLVLEAADGTVLASTSEQTQSGLAKLKPGSDLEVTGILKFEWDTDPRTGLYTGPPQATLLVRSPADIVVIRPPSPWTAQRLGWLLAATGAALGLVAAWASAMRRKGAWLEEVVAARTQELATAREQEKQTEERQRRMLEQKLATSLTASAVAHEINQPLSRLLLKCRLEADRTTDRSEFIDAVVGDAERVVTTIEKMKVLLRNVETKHEPVDLCQVVTSGLLQVKRLLAQHGVTVSRTNPSGGCIVEGDEVQLQFAVSNLLRNAAEAIAAGGGRRREIEVAVVDHGDGAEIVVGDSGPGWAGGTIDDRLLDTSKPQGTGIGLFVVRTAAQNHGGRVTVGSSRLGGAEFRLELPRRAADKA